MEQIPQLPEGHKVTIAWTSNGRRLMGTCWTTQVPSFLDRRILRGSTDIRLICKGVKHDLGGKP